MGGIFGERGRGPKPVKEPRVHWITTLSGFPSAAGWRKIKGRLVYGRLGLLNLPKLVVQPVKPRLLIDSTCPSTTHSSASVLTKSGLSFANSLYTLQLLAS